MNKQVRALVWASTGVLLTAGAAIVLGNLELEPPVSPAQAETCQQIRELLAEKPRDEATIETLDQLHGWSEPGSDAFLGCNEDAYEVRHIVEARAAAAAAAAAEQTHAPEPEPPRGPGAAGGSLDNLVSDLRDAGVDCTDWVTWDSTGSNRVIDSSASGMCRDQGIVVALYQDGTLNADDAAQDRADRGASWMVWGADWLVMFDHPAHYRAFAKHVGAT